jgi:hypothetical protein
MTRALLTASLLALSLSACSSKSGSVAGPGAPEIIGNAGYGGGESMTSAAPAAEYQGPAPTGGLAPTTKSTSTADGDATVSANVSNPTRQGLGTSFGEQHNSSVRGVRFERADQYNPDALLSMRYNDAEGVRQISAVKTGSGYLQPANRSGGNVSLTLRDEHGSPLQAAQVAGEVYAIGSPGARFTIGIENHSGGRMEIVASVDGLDVIDGLEADFSKRGYVIQPYTSFAIDGWRTSDDTVAAFRFSDMNGSYAGLTGKPRNVGVIGVAFFREAGYDAVELDRRDSADPFPNRYSTPPPAQRGY